MSSDLSYFCIFNLSVFVLTNFSEKLFCGFFLRSVLFIRKKYCTEDCCTVCTRFCVHIYFSFSKTDSPVRTRKQIQISFTSHYVYQWITCSDRPALSRPLFSFYLTTLGVRILSFPTILGLLKLIFILSISISRALSWTEACPLHTVSYLV